MFSGTSKPSVFGIAVFGFEQKKNHTKAASGTSYKRLKAERSEATKVKARP